MADLLEEIVQNVVENFKTTDVKKDLSLTLDLGNLLAADSNLINDNLYREDPESYLKDLARDNTQILINAIWKLPTERVDDEVVAKLPQPKYLLPREKPLPQPKVATRWERFAAKKGIVKKDRPKLVWDEGLKQFKPRFGKNSAGNIKERDAIIEIPDGADPYNDYFEEKVEAKKERIARNEYQRLRNIAIATNVKYRGLVRSEVDGGITKEQVADAVRVVRASTASMGKFTDPLKSEKVIPAAPNKRRKFEANYGDMKKEREKNLTILQTIQGKQTKVDVKKAVNQKVQLDSKTHAEERRARSSKTAAKRRREHPGRKKPPRGGKRGGKSFGGGGEQNGGTTFGDGKQRGRVSQHGRKPLGKKKSSRR